MVQPEKPAGAPVHVFFFFVDHFEPGENAAMMDRWVHEYPKIADRHRDSGGRPWQHTWFYPGEQPINRNMTALQKLVAGGGGGNKTDPQPLHKPTHTRAGRLNGSLNSLRQVGFPDDGDGADH